MATLAALIVALESRADGRGQFLAYAQPGLGDGPEASPICGIDVDDEAGDILLICSPHESNNSQLTLARILEEFAMLSSMRQSHSVELTLRDEQDAEQGGTALLRCDFPILSFSINETVGILSFHWTS